MRPLVNFLNQGLLPIVGRTAERERFVDFWRATTEAHGLRIALLTGEAGMGKSRLIEEITTRLRHEGGAVVHAKLYPEAATSLVPMIAGALARTGRALNLSLVAIEQTISSVSAGLRRLSHLRPTLLVIEDLQLLDGEALRDFSILLHSIADEPISLVCAARPAELTARGVLERYLVEEVELEGLTVEDLEDLWMILFESPPDPTVLADLREVTRGNCLALRSSLRSVLNRGVIARSADTGEWRLTIGRNEFIEKIRESARQIAEGMASHLTVREREIAQRLAWLGEIFSREAAHSVVEDADRAIDALIFKGVLTSARTMPTLLSGSASRRPLISFTHTLLHRHFIVRETVEADVVLEVLAADLPLYSVVPFELLADAAAIPDISAERADPAVDRAFQVITVLNRSPDWKLGISVWRAAWAIAWARREELTDEERCNLEARLLHHRLKLTRAYGPEETEKVDRFLALTAAPTSERMMEYRLMALAHHHIRTFRSDYAQCRKIWEEVDDLIRASPRLRGVEPYVQYLRGMAIAARSVADLTMVRTIEERFEQLLASESGEIVSYARRVVGPYFLDVFESEEELEHRLGLLEELQEATNRWDLGFPWLKAIFLFELGRFDEVAEQLDDLLPRLYERGLFGNHLQARLMRLWIESAFGGDLREIERQARRIYEETFDNHGDMIRATIGSYLTEIAFLRGAGELAVSIFREFRFENRPAPVALQVLTALRDPDPRDALIRIEGSDQQIALSRLVGIIVIGEEDHGAVEQTLQDVLNAPILRRQAVMDLEAALSLMEAFPAFRQKFGERLEAAMSRTLVRMLEWLAERGQYSFMETLIERHGWVLSPADRSGWYGRSVAIARERMGDAVADDGDADRLLVSMIGSIEFRTVDQEEPTRPRGGRLRTLLGVLIADRMLEKPLSNREFYRIAAGDDDIDRARSAVYVALHRLREMIGHDLIVSDGPTPRLNPELVRVDLLDAYSLIVEAERAAREEAWIRACPPLLAALDIVNGGIAFPSLYDQFFEAARSDFESRVREVVRRVARGLLREGDAARARDLLREGMKSVAADADLESLLDRTRTALGEVVGASSQETIR